MCIRNYNIQVADLSEKAFHAGRDSDNDKKRTRETYKLFFILFMKKLLNN